MKTEQIFEMAIQAGFEGCAELTWENVICTEELVAFAKLVAEKAIKEALAQPEQKYHRGDRLICLETEEYCVIHIAGTDRQWVKFPDSHIGVYTNEQVAELFELLPKEPEQEPVAWEQFYPDIGKPKFVAQPEQEPVAWMVWGEDNVPSLTFKKPSDKYVFDSLYITPPQIEVGCAECGVGNHHALYCVSCAEKFVGEVATKLQQKQETIEGLNRDYDLLFAEHQLLLKKEWVGLTEEEQLNVFAELIAKPRSEYEVYKAYELALKDKNTKGQ